MRSRMVIWRSMRRSCCSVASTRVGPVRFVVMGVGGVAVAICSRRVARDSKRDWVVGVQRPREARVVMDWVRRRR